MQKIETYRKRPNSIRESLLNWNYSIRMPLHTSIECLGAAFEFAVFNSKYIETINNIPSPALDIFYELLRLVNIHVKPCFHVREYLKNLQNHYNRTIGDVRLFYFEARNRQKNYRVFYEPFNKTFRHSLAVYKAEDGSFNVLTNIGKFFNFKTNCKYCLECNQYYQNIVFNRHRNDCPIRCPKCYRIDDKNGSCKHENKHYYCVLCNRNFYNKDCFKYHIEKKMCDKVFRCKKCMKNIHMDGLRAKTLKVNGKAHECGEKRCQICWSYHDPRKKHL